MAKYIDAEALINELQSHGAICDFGVFLIEKQPAADVQAPMVREKLNLLVPNADKYFKGKVLILITAPTAGLRWTGRRVTMETELTKTIKCRLRNFKPAMNSN